MSEENRQPALFRSCLLDTNGDAILVISKHLIPSPKAMVTAEPRVPTAAIKELHDAMTTQDKSDRILQANLPDNIKDLKLTQQGGIEKVKANATINREKAEMALAWACGSCALRARCRLAGNLEAYREKYPTVASRKELRQKQSQDPATRCDYNVDD